MWANKVMCKVKTIPKVLIYGKTYEVISETEDAYIIQDETGNIESYRKYMFDVVE